MEQDFNPVAGIVDTLAPGLRRVVAPNPSPMTFRGTNTYLLGEGQVTVVDPGPDDSAHLAAILAALRPGEWIGRILVTHSHVDHSALVQRLAEATRAPVFAYGDSDAGRSPAMETLLAEGFASGGEGADPGFAPNEHLEDGAVLDIDGRPLVALHTPGHFGNHLSFLFDDSYLLSGDQVMGWSTSIVSPPDGDMGAYMTSLTRLEEHGTAVFLPGHGAPIHDAATRIGWLRDHRLMRERQVREALAGGETTAEAIARALYTDTPPILLPAAERNVLAHLIDLVQRGAAESDGPVRAGAVFRIAES